MPQRFISPIQDIIADIRAGKMVILVDDENRENEVTESPFLFRFFRNFRGSIVHARRDHAPSEIHHIRRT